MKFKVLAALKLMIVFFALVSVAPVQHLAADCQEEPGLVKEIFTKYDRLLVIKGNRRYVECGFAACYPEGQQWGTEMIALMDKVEKTECVSVNTMVLPIYVMGLALELQNEKQDRKRIKDLRGRIEKIKAEY